MKQYNHVFLTLFRLSSLLIILCLSPLQAATPPGLPSVIVLGLTQLGEISSSPPQDAFSLPSAMNKVNKAVNITLSGTEKQTILVDGVQNIYGLSITGDVNLLNNNASSLKVILVDNSSQKEYLVYETYPGLIDNSAFSVQEVCEETCILPLITTFSLRIELENASINIRELIYTDMVPSFSIEQTGLGMKSSREMAKIQKLNEQNLGWVAGETSVSKLSYEEKKRLFIEPVVPNLNGFEYYRGGVFEIPGTPSLPNASTLVTNFSWGNRHGENWITPVKDQGGCGSCWAFAATGATEAVTNLYFNQHLDLDLAEQEAVSCSGAGSCKGGDPGSTLSYFTTTGLIGEQCFPYSATDQACNNKCRSPNELIKISGKTDFTYPKSEDTLKRMIIENGPVSGGIATLSHAMTLVGFETDPSNGRIVWIFKNSWGQDWGGKLDNKWGEGNAEGGYARVKLEINNIEWTHAIVNPIISVNHPYQINCVDKDNDGYCNWGISKDKPATCPASCKLERDCDDSNPSAGPFDANYNCGGNNPPPPAEKSFTIHNDGNANLIVNAIIPETAAPWLSIPTSTPFTISPGGSQVVRVQVASSAPKGTVRLLVNSNDPDENPYPNGVNIEVKRQSGSLPIATRPSSTLPALNQPTAQPIGQPTDTHATFYGGIAVNGQPYQSQTVLKLTDTVEVTGDFIVDPTDIGKVADIFIYAAADFPWDTNNTYYYTVGEGYSVSPWDQKPYELVPFMPNVTLGVSHHVAMWKGTFPVTGTLDIFFGYRLPNGILVSNKQPIEATIQ